MAYSVLINGFGRIGKLATRLAWYDHKKTLVQKHQLVFGAKN